MSDLTVVDFDENYIYEDLLKLYPNLKDHLTVKLIKDTIYILNMNQK